MRSRDAPPQRLARMPPPDHWLVPRWPVSDTVRALFTTRTGGVSEGAWSAPGTGSRASQVGGGGMNLGLATGDRPVDVERNRSILGAYLPSAPRWLALEHGARVVDAETVGAETATADASIASAEGVVCCVTVADCLPVFLADQDGRMVGVAHAGWRGLAAGVLQAAVQAMRKRMGRRGAPIVAFLGPCIGPTAFEVGADVLDAMRVTLPQAEHAFRPLSGSKYLADLPALARQALAQVDVEDVHGGLWCTHSDPARFYSFRRDKVTGRHAALIWREPSV
jgi:YfiH family protein